MIDDLTDTPTDLKQKLCSQRLSTILLDRDGVLNIESSSFIKRPAEWLPIDRAMTAVAKLQQHFQLAVCTNQSGIGRQLFTLSQLDAIHQKLQSQLQQAGGQCIDIFFCPHLPEQGCDCRKPAPGLLAAAMTHFSASPDTTLFVGDSQRDIEAGLAAGCHVALVQTGNGQTTAVQLAKQNISVPVWSDLAALTADLIG